MSEIFETRGERKKRKARERIQAKRTDRQFFNREREGNRERQANMRADPQRHEVLYERVRQSKREAKRRRVQERIERDLQVEEIGVPLRVFEMDEEFGRVSEEYKEWPRQLDAGEARIALAEFREKVNPVSLRELPCSVCSELRSCDQWKRVSVRDVNLSLVRAPTELIQETFEIDYDYRHPDIDNVGYKVLLDRAGFIYPESSPVNGEDQFDLRVCSECQRFLKENKTPSLSLSRLWIGPTPQCLQDLSIPEQLLISPGYLCVNIVQMSNKRHNHHKLKGHVVTLPQNPGSLMKILPLPMYRICEYIKVVFVGQGHPNERQLKKVFQVRRSKVSAALRWLIKHNILFKDVQIDDEALKALPEGDIPEAIRMTTTVVDVDSRQVENYTGYDQDPIGEDEDIGSSDEEDDSDVDGVNGLRELRSSGIIDIDSLSVLERERVLRAVQDIVTRSDSIEISSKDLQNGNSGCVESSSGPSNQAGIIRIPHSNMPMNEYNEKSLFPAGFPVLFPYGCGGHIDSKNVSLATYAKHLMRHQDPKFRQHRSFPFVIFDVLRRREVFNQCRVTSKGSCFQRSAQLISRLTSDDMKEAIEQLKSKEPISNPSVLELFRNVNSVGSRLIASNQSRSRMRNEIRGVIIKDGAPSLFMTINPADLHSPIVMMYAGKEVDVEKILAENPEEFPMASERARLAHLDPCAVAKYFNVIIEGIIEIIIGFGRKSRGVFGDVKNYYEVVEYQDRGTPHCHLLVWLHGVPEPQTMRRKLVEDGAFSERLLQYISGIVKEDVSYLLAEEEILTDEMLREEYARPKTNLERRMHPSFFPIPDPCAPDFEERFRADLLSIAKRTLFHSCMASCKKYRRGSEHACRFDFPRELVDPPGVVFPEQGIIASQRVNAFINNHNPYVTAACRGNNDIKFISTRRLALAYIHYITDYITKADSKIHNSFLLCAATLESFLAKSVESNQVDVVGVSKRLIAKCLNRIASQKEVTGPQVASYLLGNHDCYTLYKFTTIHLDSFWYFVQKEWNELRGLDSEDPEENDSTEGNEEGETFLVPSTGEGFIAVNLRVDYQFRGPALRNMCLYDYAATIRKIPISSKDLTMEAEQVTRDGNSRVDRFFFLGGDVACAEDCDHATVHPQHRTHMQMHRLHGKENVVVLAGKGVPKKEDQEKSEQYGLYILVLFKPWEHVGDLRAGHESWASACEVFLADASLSPRLRSVIDNIELLHRCAEETAIGRCMRESSRNDPRVEKARRIERSISGYDAVEEELEIFDELEALRPDDNTTEENGRIDPAKIVRAGLKNPEMVDDAMRHLRLRNRMNDMVVNATTRDLAPDAEEMDLFDNSCIRLSDSSDNRQVEDWNETIKSRRTGQDNQEVVDNARLDTYDESTQRHRESSGLEADILKTEEDILNECAVELNQEQKKAFFLFCDHRRRNVHGSRNKPSQLLLFLEGAGGTGKSKVINAIRTYFARIGKSHTLLVLSYTGIAAVNVSGNTIHSALGLGFGEDGKRNKLPTGSALAEFQQRWLDIEYIIIDEVSVIGQRLLARIHASLKLAKGVDNDQPFAGMNILFAGDFMQLPPVQDQPLYAVNKVARIVSRGSSHSQRRSDGIGSNATTNAIGRALWHSVKHVVRLTQPMRQANDPFYAEILESMRQGKLSENHKEALRAKVLGDDRIASSEWKEAAFLVSRNQLRVQLNFDAAREYAINTDQYIVYSCAEDFYRRAPLKGRHRRRFLSVSDVKENSLCGILPLSVGMKIMLTINICTKDGLVNGAEGILRQIVIDEHTIDFLSSSGKSVVLKRAPKYVVVELLSSKPGPYEGLPLNHVPIYPVKSPCVNNIWTNDGTQLKYQFQRFQLPLTPAFAFTDYKCQGRTLQKVVVDLAEGTTSTGMYVMLSRVQRLADLLILRPFNELLLDMKIPAALQEELNRLEACSKETEKLERWPDYEG